MPAAVLALEPDVVVLTEYVRTEQEPYGHRYLVDELREGGLEHFIVSTWTARGDNQVVIAARSPIVQRPTPATTIPYAQPNVLRVAIPDAGLDVIGLRVPFFHSTTETRAYWEWFDELARSVEDQPALIIGDVNFDFGTSPSGWRGRALKQFQERGWHMPRPDGEWSYASKTSASRSRIDHALVRPGIEVHTARYVSSLGSHSFAGHKDAISDHAAFVLDLVPLPEARTSPK